ncbi:peptidoglycan -binding protein [Pseudooceanicola sp. LIPI14-2-Ac024]|uniref:peptidoglycan -binding protein n=1 Tax=Pseudooceanicola sp. LIPI14-2-Ac024 TaxID=3344875 RepID=UPI0035D10B82
MALSRRNSSHRNQHAIWPGFVDAMTGLLLVLMFVLTIFMVVQFVLKETITGQESQLDELSGELAELARALGMERDRTTRLQADLGTLNATLADAEDQAEAQAALIASLTSERDQVTADLRTARARITDFESQVAALLAERNDARNQVADLEEARQALISDQEALQLALARAREEIDAGAEAARLSAARREALEALIADLRREAAEADQQNVALSDQVASLQEDLSDEEKARLAEAAAAQALRERLKGAEDELTAMTLALEEQRKRAEDTLTLLAAARDKGDDLTAQLAAALVTRDETTGRVDSLTDDLEAARAALAAAEAERDALAREIDTSDRDEIARQLAAALAAKLAAEQAAGTRLSEAEQREVLLRQAQKELAEQEALSAESRRKAELLNQQVSQLRSQLGALQAVLDDAKDRDAANRVEMANLGRDLNAALAQAAAEQRRRAELEEAERKRLEAANEDLEKYRSDFFGRLRDLLAEREGVQVVGDRFVFSSEVLFAPAEARLSSEGRDQIANVAALIRDVSAEIPEGIDWILRVDGHTDNVPLTGNAQFADNWELSQARALSVVRFMSEELGIPPERLSANGFGQYQPIAEGDSPEARAQNRRIELKLTER